MYCETSARCNTLQIFFIEEIHYRDKANGMVSFLLAGNNNVVCNPEYRFAGGSRINRIGDPCLVISSEVAGMF